MEKAARFCSARPFGLMVAIELFQIPNPGSAVL